MSCFNSSTLQSRLTWGPYFLFQTWRMATATISGRVTGVTIKSSLSLLSLEVQYSKYCSLYCASFYIYLQRKVCKVLNISTFCFYSVCDYLGERLASLLGITTPKYQYAIDEYYRMKKEVRGHRPGSHP